MWNLLVVDDEPIVRMGLRYMVDWDSLGIVWKAEASSGEEAWSLLDQDDIHIVMTDIRMPGLDGLELSKRIKERRPEIPVIILSSYDTFSYVKEALRIGAADYLHKPTMDENEIGATLRKVVGRLEETLERSAVFAAEDRDAYLLQLLDRFTFPADARLPEQSLLASGYWLTVFRRRDDAVSDTDSDHLRFQSIRHLIEDYVGKDWGGVVFHRSYREVIWIAPDTAKSGHADKTKYLDAVRRKVLEYLNAALIYASSDTHANTEELPDAYMEALLRLPVNEQSDNQIVRRAKAFIDEHLLEDIGLSKVAEAIVVSPGHLSRIFQQQVGETFIDYITRNKLDYAQKLLRSTNRKVYDIAAEVGYANPHYFSKLFKERKGITPLEYRNQ
ncbi:response regulator [Cohnella ginsengisoli]|uniref:Response regulator n=1 Tax=Cohnella ginsengisoli TaxID=425004 RepID=A0A9X4QL64_9BACL|nr:response regulator [Cohnella ginsengisoli]MDG0790384.1 response regulator [Cohnella ginsengisoli]